MKVYICLFAVVATTLSLPHGDHGDHGDHVDHVDHVGHGDHVDHGDHGNHGGHGNHSDHYTDKYDTINVDDIIANSRLFDPYVQCILEVGRCAPEAKELKSHIKDALETHCAKCTEVQKEQTKKVIRHLINNKASDWDKLKQKYDPEGKYSKKYEHELRIVKA